MTHFTWFPPTVSAASPQLCFLPILCFCQNGFVKLCHSGFRCDRWYFLRPNYEKSCSESPCASISGLVTLNFLFKSFIQVIFVKRNDFLVIKLSRGKSDVHLHLISHHCWGHFLIIDVLNEQCTSPQEEFKSRNVSPFFMRKWIVCETVFKLGFRTFWCLVIKWCG